MKPKPSALYLPMTALRKYQVGGTNRPVAIELHSLHVPPFHTTEVVLNTRKDLLEGP